MDIVTRQAVESRMKKVINLQQKETKEVVLSLQKHYTISTGTQDFKIHLEISLGGQISARLASAAMQSITESSNSHSDINFWAVDLSKPSGNKQDVTPAALIFHAGM